MTIFLLFATIFLFSFAGLVFLVGIDSLAHPFKDSADFSIGIAATLFVGPALLTAAFIVNDQYHNYCPPLEPIAAPDLAEAVTIESTTQPQIEIVHATDLHRIAALESELEAKTSALSTASKRILELENRIKVLESVRIDAPRATPTPVPVAPTNPPCRGPRCTRG